MAGDPDGTIVYREATELDADAITGLFRVAYGEGYVHPHVYDPREIKRMIFQDSSLVLVAEHEPTGTIVGTAGVLFEMGAYSDLVGEFGRLVVSPEWRGRGIGSRLMEERLRRVGTRLHVAFVEVRVGSPASPAISQAHGFVPVGALPQKLVFGGTREHAALLVRHFGDALALRRNHPRIIPEASTLADAALRGVGIEPDMVLDEAAVPYPPGARYALEELSEQGYSALLRIERGRLRAREVFGPQRLHYGLSRLAASESTYLVARDGERIVGALGFMQDDVERHVRVFEVIHAAEDVIRVLFDALASRCARDGIMGAEVDVGADATRMQRTLLSMGYLPSAYVPAMAFHDVERIDVVKMYRLFEPLQDLPFEAPEPTRSIGLGVVAQFEAAEIRPRLLKVARGLALCDGLTEEQSARLLGAYERRHVDPGTELFAVGDAADEMLLVVEGEVEVSRGGHPVGRVGSGECLGESAFLNEVPHTATATVTSASGMVAGVLSRRALQDVVRRRPDIAAVVYRNLARGLGEKLRRADPTGPRVGD